MKKWLRVLTQWTVLAAGLVSIGGLVWMAAIDSPGARVGLLTYTALSVTGYYLVTEVLYKLRKLFCEIAVGQVDQVETLAEAQQLGFVAVLTRLDQRKGGFPQAPRSGV